MTRLAFSCSFHRVFTDPATLLPYARDERVYWYASFGRRAADSILESGHLTSRAVYSRQ
jgi:hypothetical protein